MRRLKQYLMLSSYLTDTETTLAALWRLSIPFLPLSLHFPWNYWGFRCNKVLFVPFQYTFLEIKRLVSVSLKRQKRLELTYCRASDALCLFPFSTDIMSCNRMQQASTQVENHNTIIWAKMLSGTRSEFVFPAVVVTDLAPWYTNSISSFTAVFLLFFASPLSASLSTTEQ